MNWRQKLASNAFRWSDRVLYVDRSVIVMNKPPGLVTQLDPTTTNTDGGNLAKLLDDLKESLQLPNPPYRVHRLDKGTTGCFLLARSLGVARELSTQFRNRAVEKTYLALVRGGSKSFPREKGGKIRTNLRYIDGRGALVPEGEPLEVGQKEAKTDWKVVASSPHLPLSLLRLKLITGHKHQLRVHLAQILKTPILGDAQHSQSQPVQIIQDAFNLPNDRIFLHASQVEFDRYRPTGGHKRFRLRMFAPLPPDFIQICEEAGIPLGKEERLGGLFKSETGHEQDYEPITDGEIPAVAGSWIPPIHN
ncbi:pseudouridine synthase [Mycena belliarum]|uniref:21S rRNA pseudouridine(2819) synthase n=1 Tax=Mycena belliarum TaxID=1033014 RepID=A0AAD6UJG3_9AGAR|nr:pseudouridine synthase [Mycena belliae]